MSSQEKKSAKILISINYEASKGGISRVARLMAEAIDFDQVLSLYGNVKEKNVCYFNQHFLRFTLFFLQYFYTRFPRLLVFDHVGPASLLVLIPRLLLKNRKVVVFLHDEEAWRKITSRHAWGLDKATHILCNSEYTYHKFIRSNPKYTSKTKVCLLAGVSSVFHKTKDPAFPKHSSKILPQGRYCIFVSRLWKEHRYKGYFELLNAFVLHYQKKKNAVLKLVIIGSGNDAKNIADFIVEHKLEKAVYLFTDVSDQELLVFYKNSDCLIFPSTREGFGFVFLEAMYFSKACIGIKNQPAEEIILPGKTGILLNNAEPETIEHCLEDIESNPAKYEEFGKEGYKHFQQKFMNKHFIERFLACIES